MAAACAEAAQSRAARDIGSWRAGHCKGGGRQNAASAARDAAVGVPVSVWVPVGVWAPCVVVRGLMVGASS